MSKIEEVEAIINALDLNLTFDEMLAKVNDFVTITDEEMFELSFDSMLISQFIDRYNI